MTKKDFITAKYYLETERDLHEAADSLAGEQSTGTWLRVDRETKALMKNHRAKVGKIKESYRGGMNKGVINISFPHINFGPVIPMLLTSVAGNLFEMGDFKNVKLLDLEFPKNYIKKFKGPKFGIKGTMKAAKVKNRPMVGCIVKPCVGLDPQGFADACYDVAKGGIDFIKDDELIANPEYSKIKNRVPVVMDALDKADDDKDETTLYAVNVTDEIDKIMENADTALENGANCLMLNFITAGFSALRVLCEDPSIRVPIHCHRDMFAAFTRSDFHGIHTVVVSKLARLCGGDQVHAGAIYGKLYEDIESVMQSVDALTEDWFNIIPSLPVSSGGQHPAKIPENYRLLKNDALILAGGGIFGHKNGAAAGARAMRLALDATIEGISLEDCAKEHEDLKIALEQWKVTKR
jgi:ribulose 1,5-bisphosphate carboxylase large subunit-like protein|tara:strand:+ start:2750 stop:3973 length:1224 start_codon:yes stop_codon:yes gene_type:complete